MDVLDRLTKEQIHENKSKLVYLIQLNTNVQLTILEIKGLQCFSRNDQLRLYQLEKKLEYLYADIEDLLKTIN